MVIPFSSIVEPNGKTIRENNMDLSHKFPIGSLVEYKLEEWYGDGACAIIHARKFVVAHTRDCDGTPMYHVGSAPIEQWLEEINPDFFFPGRSPNNYKLYKLACDLYKIDLNLSERMLTLVEVTPDIKYGKGQLSW